MWSVSLHTLYYNSPAGVEGESPSSTSTSTSTTSPNTTSSHHYADTRQQLDLFVADKKRVLNQAPLSTPTEAQSPPSRPLIVYVHGGLWVDRDKSDYHHLAQYWCSTFGYHVALINYRQSSSKAGGIPSDDGSVILHPAHTNDLLKAIRFLADDQRMQSLNCHIDGFVLVGHSCGGHMCGLVMLAEPSVSQLSLEDDNGGSSLQTLRQRVRGVIGIEGIYDNYAFACDFPDWSSGISDAFGHVKEKWESPIDYLKLTKDETDSSPSNGSSSTTPSYPPSSPSRHAIQQSLASLSPSIRLPSRSIPWLIIHSHDDPWVNMPQAVNFHKALTVTYANYTNKAEETNVSTNSQQFSSTTVSSSSSSSSFSAAIPPSQLILIHGAHFEVIERIGTEKDEITKPVQTFLEKLFQ